MIFQKEINMENGMSLIQDYFLAIDRNGWIRLCKRTGLVFFVASLLFLSMSAKAESHLMFEKANQLYHNRLYDSAAGLYQQMMNDGYFDPALFYNAGNAYYRSNKTGMAIWCFRRAQMVGADRFINENLALAQRRIREPILAPADIFFIRWWKAFYSLLSLNAWAMLALVSFLAGMLLLSLQIMRLGFRVSRVLRYGIFSCTLLALLMTAVRWWQQTYRFHGIIIGNRIQLRIMDGEQEWVNLPEGTEVVCLRRARSGLLVRVPDGQVGEIPSFCFKRL